MLVLMMNERLKNISEGILSNQNSAETIGYACDDSVINLVKTEELEVDFTCIDSTNKTNDIYMHDDGNYFHKYYSPFLSSNIHEYLYTKQDMIQQNTQFIVRKLLFWNYYWINQRF